MRVVYSPAHLGHEIRHPDHLRRPGARERGRRACRADPRHPRGRRRLQALRGPTEHGDGPDHSPSTTRASCAFLEEAWPETRRAGDRPHDFIAAETYPDVPRCSRACPSAVRREPGPRSAAGRAGGRGLDTSTPIVAGTYAAARAAVDVALTTVDLVLGGEAAAYGLCRPPGHHAARRCPAATASSTTPRSRPRRSSGGRASASRSSTSTTTTATAPSRSSGAAATSCTSRSTPTRERQYPFFLGHADEIGEGPGAGANLNLPLPRRHRRRRVPRRARPRPRGDRGDAGLGRRRLARVRHVRARPDRRLRAHDGRATTRCGRRVGGARPAARDPPGGRLLPCRRSARTPAPWLRGAEGLPVRAARRDRARRAPGPCATAMSPIR